MKARIRARIRALIEAAPRPRKRVKSRIHVFVAPPPARAKRPPKCKCGECRQCDARVRYWRKKLGFPTTGIRPPKARKPRKVSCTCGKCPKCKRRELMRLMRAIAKPLVELALTRLVNELEFAAAVNAAHKENTE